MPIETFVATLAEVAPGSAGPVTHGDRVLPIAPDLDDSRLDARLGPIPRTPLQRRHRRDLRAVRQLREEGRLDLSDLG